MKKILLTLTTFFISFEAMANQPKEWQLGFQEAASESMRDIISFHDNLLLPIIVAISAFVLFLMLYVCIKFRASANPNPSKRTHNVAVEVLWTLIPCLILIVIAVPSFKILYKQDAIPKADLTIKAIGYQWYWGYEYPDENIIFDSYMVEDKDLKADQPRLLAVDNEVVVPVNKVVKVLITANDVLHAWALPSFGVKRDAVPGTASLLTPNDGNAQACSTSLAVIKTFTTLFTGTNISLSTVKSLGCPGCKSSSSIMYESKIIFSSGYS